MKTFKPIQTIKIFVYVEKKSKKVLICQTLPLLHHLVKLPYSMSYYQKRSAKTQDVIHENDDYIVYKSHLVTNDNAMVL